MREAHLSRHVLQAQGQPLLQRSAAGIAEDDGVWVDVDAIGINVCAFRLDESDTLLHCAVVPGKTGLMLLLRLESIEHVQRRWRSGSSARVAVRVSATLSVYPRPDLRAIYCYT